MSALIKKISGQLTDMSNNTLGHFPFGITIEFSLALDSDNPGGWIGSAPVKQSGQFDLFTAYDMPVSRNVSYKIFKDAQQITTGDVDVIDYATSIQLDEETYQALAKPYVSGCVKIKGTITLGQENIAAVPVDPGNVSVKVRRVSFRTTETLATTTINSNGSYCIDLPLNMLGLSVANGIICCSGAQYSKLYITLSVPGTLDEDDETILLKTGDFEITQECISMDIFVEEEAHFSLFKPELTYLLDNLNDTGLMVPSQIHTVSTDGTNNEIPSLSAALCINESILYTLVNAAKIADVLGRDIDTIYGLLRSGCDNLYEMVNLSQEEIDLLIAEAVNNHIIGAADIEQLRTVLDGKRADIAGEELTDNGDSILHVFTVILDSATDAKTFLKLNAIAEETGNATTLWTSVTTALGSTKTSLLKRGLQLLAITGMQAELTRVTLDDLGTADVKSLISLVKDDWKSKISRAATRFSKVCIPKSIIDQYAAENAASAYADRILELISNIFANEVIATKMSGDNALLTKLTKVVEIVNYIDANPDFDIKTSDLSEIEDPVVQAALMPFEAYLPTIEGGNDGLIDFIKAKTDTETQAFWSNPDGVDLRVQNVWDIGNAIVRNALMPVQNLMRLADGQPDTVISFLKEGVRSSADVTEMSQDDFVFLHSAKFNDNTDKALAFYAKAAHVVKISTEAKMSLTPGNYISDLFTFPKKQSQSGSFDKPDLKTLFGSLDLCSCSECTSMYSPGAYFTDILNFMKTKLGSPSKPFTELLRRRADLTNIDLTCKNANTPVPYVDLVNELLELVALRNTPSGQTPLAPSSPLINLSFSYQTSGTAKELAAYPEHTYKDSNGNYTSSNAHEIVYNERLSRAMYPNNLPFSLPVEESRTYLKHIGYSRYDLMRQFHPTYYYTSSADSDLNEYNALAEWLGISRKEADIIITSYAGSNLDLVAPFFGYATSNGSWHTNLASGETGEGLNTLLYRSRISYKEMLQMLVCEFVNPTIIVSGQAHHTFEIVSTDLSNPATCDITKLYLKYNGTGNATTETKKLFDRWHRFLRLQRATGWSFYQLDVVLRSFGAVTDINMAFFKAVAKTHQLASLAGMLPERICALWSTISTTNYINFSSDNQDKMPSVYDSLFRNKAVLNPPDSHFGLGGAITGTYEENKAAIIAAFNITEDEFVSLANYYAVTITNNVSLSQLSLLYGFTVLAKGLNLSIKDALRIVNLFGTTFTVSAGDVSNAAAFADNVNRLRKIAFSLDEVEYLLLHIDEKQQFIPANDVIQDFYTKLRADLKQLNIYPLAAGTTISEVDASRLKEAIEQNFAVTFGIEKPSAEHLLDSIQIGSMAAHEALALESFVTSTDDANPIVESGSVSGLDFEDLYIIYKKMHKAAFIINKLKLSAAELIQFYNWATGLEVTQIESLFGGSSSPVFDFLNLNDWITVRDRFAVKKEAFLPLLKEASGAGTYATWKQAVSKIVTLELTELENLTGTGRLQLGYDDCNRATVILQIADIVAASQAIGLNIDSVWQSLIPIITMAQARAIRMAAKSHHNEDAWLKVAKPLQDVLRERQRQSLVAYITGTPGIIAIPTGSTLTYKTEAELFEYLLIDVEMKPCMKTSRIKQGISSVQLFMDRIILSLENVNGIPGSLITLTSDKVKQWESWRKWYRVWEANRKIFMYPENWIEPELRDDKTPFFKELETQLLQDEVTDITAENAYMDYMQQLDEVSRLEPVSAFRQTEAATATEAAIDIVHVFARTQTLPHRYYYRKLEKNEWTPWEKMNVDVKSDHIAPLIWNRKLYLFWLTFKSKKSSNSNDTSTGAANSWIKKMTGPIVTDADNDRHDTVDITLNWTRFKDNKWQATEVCKDVMDINLDRIKLANVPLNSYDQTSVTGFVQDFANNKDLKMDELFKNRLHLQLGYLQTGELVISVQMALGLNETAIAIHSFIWDDSTAQPRVVRETDYGTMVVAPAGTRFDKNKLVRRSDNVKLNVTTDYLKGFGYYVYAKDWIFTNANIIDRKTSAVVLNNTPFGRYKITAKGNNNTGDAAWPERNPLHDNFFFEDNRNTYYVAKEAGLRETTTKNIVYVKQSGTATLVNVKTIGSISYPLADTLQAMPQQQGTTTATNGLYRFHTFYHAQITKFNKALNKDGVPGLLKLANQSQADTMLFQSNYQPNGTWVSNKYPRNNVQFDFDEAYSIYNWELFFHAPMMIAQRLSDNQQFEEARKWYHYIFDPTSSKDDLLNVTTGSKERFWKFYPFYKESLGTPTTLTDLLISINQGLNTLDGLTQVQKWEDNPFKPHVIARLRKVAYMKNVLMKYLDNILAWADQLFGLDTIESINEATQLYILAGHLLGKRPEEVPARAAVSPKTFNDLAAAGLDVLSNAMVGIESYFAPNSGPLPGSGGGKDDHSTNPKMFYFCLPKNDKLLAYWDTVADRLFKIRNCMNIDGTVRELALYEPPIDPALLVRAAAQGISIGTVLQSLSGNNGSPYRFSYVLQKANEFCNDVKSLGGALLSAIEKKDAEELALLRSGQEMQLLEKVRYIKEVQVQEAEANLEAMNRTRENTQMRQQYYATRSFMNSGESQHLKSIQDGMILQSLQSGLQTVSSTLALIPQFHGQAAFAIGASFGGEHLSAALNAISAGVGIAATINNAKGSMALTRAGYERRMDDWTFQASSAAKEMEQMDQQVLAAEIRLDIANRELANHEQQMENTAETDTFMRNKFSNKELYSWMVNQVSATYFQSYKLACDLAKKAEKAFDVELPMATKPAAGFINFAYWDSLRKGLLSGEKLQFDLRRMETAYMDANKRELELTKNYSLVINDPMALLALRENGNCIVNIPEEIYDLDYPGHINRRIKSVSISIPCIAGPYTTIPATLTLNQHFIRLAPDNNAPVYSGVSGQSIATSTAQNDAGVFELNFRDERYLPFEGRGAVSEWQLKLTSGEEQIRTFDFSTVSDVIIHIRYTANDAGSETFTTNRINAVNALLSNTDSDPTPLPRYFSLKHDFSGAWYKGFDSAPVSISSGGTSYTGKAVDLVLNRGLFPEFARGKNIEILTTYFVIQPKAGNATAYKLAYNNGTLADVLENVSTPLNIPAGDNADKNFGKVALYKAAAGGAVVSASDIEDIFFIVNYKLS